MRKNGEKCEVECVMFFFVSPDYLVSTDTLISHNGGLLFKTALLFELIIGYN